jgi:collagen type VII alpha
MSYGSIKVDTITYTSGGGDATSSVSGLADAVNGIFPNLSITGTISGTTITGDNVSFTNVTGVSGTFTDTLSGATITGDTGQYETITAVTGIFTATLSGATITGVSGTFTDTLSGATITGDTGQYGTITAVTGIFTDTLSGATITGDEAGFTSITGTTVTGTTANFDYGNFTSNVTGVTLIGTTTVSGATVTGGIIGVGTNVTFPDGSTQTTAATATANAATTTGIQTFTAAQRGEVDVVAYATGIALDFSSGNNFQISLTGNTTLQNPSNIASGQAGAIYIIQNSSGNTMAFGSYWNYPGGSGSVPSLTATSGATDLLVYYTTSTTGIAFRLVQDIKA